MKRLYILLSVLLCLYLCSCQGGFFDFLRGPDTPSNPADSRYDPTEDFNNSKNNIPVAPTELTLIEAAVNSVSFSWKDNSDFETGFRIMRRTPDADDFIEIANIPSPDTVSFTAAGF